MNLSIAIVDDDEKDANRLKQCLTRYAAENNLHFDIAVYTGALAFISEYKAKYNVVFMDISMPLFNGMQAAKSLRQLDESVVLVFVTTMAQYAVKGYEVNALDFVVKPVNYENMSVKMRRIVREAVKRRNTALLIDFNNTQNRVEIGDIVYFESQEHNIKIHLSDGRTLQVRQPLSSFAEKLSVSPYYFIRCNHCYLVNPKYINAVHGSELLLSGGETLQISRAKKNEVVKLFAQYVGNN